MLTGEPNLGVDEYRAELKAVDLAALHEVAGEVMASALLMVPGRLTADWAGFVAAPTHSTSAVYGTTYTSREGSGALRIGDDGVSYLGSDGVLTIRYDECAAMLAWPDGARQLIGSDAIVLHIEPTMFNLHSAALPILDAKVPADRQVAMPARAPEAIPSRKPRDGPRNPTSAPGGRSRCWWSAGSPSCWWAVSSCCSPSACSPPRPSRATSGSGEPSWWAGCSLLSSRCPSCCYGDGGDDGGVGSLLAGDPPDGIRSGAVYGAVAQPVRAGDS
ncbi:hypothetical protein GCM10027614_30580 [Micromonospora vulcania]